MAAKPQLNGHADGGVARDVFPVTTSSHPGGRQPAWLQALRDQLTHRDQTTLHALAALRLATTRQLQRLVYNTGSPGTRMLRARRGLQRLHSLGLVARLHRPIGGPRAGSTSYTHHLTPTGQRITGTRPSRANRAPERHTCQHTLAVTELAVSLWEAHRARHIELVCFEAEPTSWRSYSLDGARRYIRPDAFTILAVGEWERLWFVELDRGTQSGAVLRRKAHAYHTYATTSREQDRWGVFPRVAYLVATPERQRALARALAATPDADQLVTVALATEAATLAELPK